MPITTSYRMSLLGLSLAASAVTLVPSIVSAQTNRPVVTAPASTASPANVDLAGHNGGKGKNAGHNGGKGKDAGHNGGKGKDAGHNGGKGKNAGHNGAKGKNAGHNGAKGKNAGHNGGKGKNAGHNGANANHAHAPALIPSPR